MNEHTTKRLDEIALFRYGLIADLKDLPAGTKGQSQLLAEKAAKHHRIPGSTRTRVNAETLRQWLRAYRKAGFEALKPKVRKDAGSSHAIPEHVIDLLCDLKENKPELSVQLIIRELREAKKLPDGLVLAPSTVHRLLARRGLMRKKDPDAGRDRRRFTFENAGDLWMSDVMHGPSVFTTGRSKRKAYLIAFIDDATRVVPFATFALSENTSAFLPVLKQAVMRRGIPKRLYVDNGSAFRSHQLSLVCAKLGITLIHARPYHPEGKGKMERWFRTARMQLLTRLKPEDTASLEALNRRLWAYVEGEYHHTPHGGLDRQTPVEVWAVRAAGVQYVGARTDLDDIFLFEERRHVQRDRTVSLHGIAFEVDAALVGKSVLLRFDPQRPRGPVQVLHDGQRFSDAKPVDTAANCFVRRNNAPVSLDGASMLEPEKPDAPPTTDEPASQLRLADLAANRDHDDSLAKEVF